MLFQFLVKKLISKKIILGTGFHQNIKHQHK